MCKGGILEIETDTHTVTNKIACSEFYDLLTNKCVDKFNERRKCLSIRFSHFSSQCAAADEVAEAGGEKGSEHGSRSGTFFKPKAITQHKNYGSDRNQVGSSNKWECECDGE